MKLSTHHVDLGAIEVSARATASFDVANVGKVPLHFRLRAIRRIDPSCCATGSFFQGLGVLLVKVRVSFSDAGFPHFGLTTLELVYVGNAELV